MSYQVLARKWRPQRFDQVVGQQHVLSALENGLRENRLHHAYLFSGTRGVGKTSIARLFAKGLNCELGITATPCGECENCKAIEEGRFMDLIEIDAASRTKVEDTRELLDNVQYKPTLGRFKVYLIDEVHMLSRHSFNALLKTLEEPPEYVKFLLATTDPQKLPITILSRCMQFHLRALEQAQIRQHLEFVLTQENLPFETPALDKLAKAAQGSIRDSLSLTDQAIAMSNGHITLTVVNQMLGLIEDHQPLELVQALANADGEKAMAVLQTVAEKGVDWQQLLSDVAETLHKVAMLQLLPRNGQDETMLHHLARQIAPEDVQFYYQLMLTGKKELPFAPEQRSGVEMTFLRALAFHPKRIEQIATPASPAPIAPANAPLSANNNRFEQARQQLQQTQPQQAIRSEPEIAKPSAQTTAPVAPATPSATAATSGALQALNARKQLQQAQANLATDEKKKPEPLTPATPPVRQTQAKSQDLQQRFASLANATPVAQSNITKPLSPTVTTDEDYRWTWLNPELEHESEGTKPSDIKQAILQERTPELVQKTIAISCEQDEWCNIVNDLKLGGLSRQMALNSYLAEKEGDNLHLVLKPAMAHLNNPESHQSLQQALQEKGFTYQLTIGDRTDLQTPLERRRAIFEQLTQDAKNALIADKKLQQLRETFSAEIDESTIRAVG